MKTKIVGIAICLLLISSTTTLALTPFRKNEQQMKQQLSDTTPVPLPQPKGWMKTFGKFGEDYGYSVRQTFDGGYIIAGSTNNLGGGGDVWLIKTDKDGNMLWDKIFGGNDWDEAYSVQQTSDGGYIIAGSTGVDFWLIKTDSNGNIVWDTTYGGNDHDEAYSVQQTSDNGYIIAGTTRSFGAGITNAWLVKIDADGNKIWDRTFGRKYGNLAYSVQQTSDNGYIIAGATGGFGDVNGDVWLIKTDSQGKSKTTSSDNLWFERLFHRFPNAFPILRQLLGL